MASRSTFAVACVLLASASGAHQACAARGPALSRVGPPRAHVQLMPLAVGAKRAKKGDAAAVAPPVAAGKDAEDADPAAGLEVWLADNGVAMGAVCIEQRELRDIGWGLRAAAPAAAGAVLATVPATRLLAADAGAEHKLGESLGVAIPEQQWALPLALRLLREQLHPASSWAGYTRSLPGRFGAHPTSYDDDELRALKSDWLSSRLCDQRDLIDALAGAAATTASAAVLEAFPAARPTISDLRWACAAAASRALAVGGASGEEPALVPLLDLCNHAHAPSCEVRRDAKTGAVMLVALAPIEKGEALTLNYGNIGAAERVLRYGFVDEEADPDDFVIVNWDGLALDAAHTLGEPKQMGAALHVGSAPKQDAHTPADPDTPDDLADFQKKAMHALGLLAGADGSFPTEGVRVYADRLDGRLLAALRVLYAKSEMELEGRSLEALHSDERVLADALEERVRQTCIGFAMLAAGSCAYPALAAGFGGGMGRFDAHMLVAGRAKTSGARSTNTRIAHAFRFAQMHTAIAALRYSKSTLLHAAPVESAFAAERAMQQPVVGRSSVEDGGHPGRFEDAPEMSELEELEMLERQAGSPDEDLWQKQFSDLDAF